MKWNRVLATTALSVAVAVTAVPASAGPAESFAKKPDFFSVKISPKGDRLAITRNNNGRVILSIVQLSDMKPLGAFGITDARDVQDVYWVSNDRIVFGLSYHLGTDEAPVRTGDMFAVNVDGSDVKLLLGRVNDNDMRVNVAATYRDWEIVDTLKDDPDNILIIKYDDSEAPYLVRINVKNGRQRRLAQARGRAGSFETDNASKVRVQGGYDNDDHYFILIRPTEDADWQELRRYTDGDKDAKDGKGKVAEGKAEGKSAEGKDASGDGRGVSFLGFAADNRSLFLSDNRRTRTESVYLQPTDGGATKLLYTDPTYDVSELLPGRTPGAPLGVTWTGERTQWKYFNPEDSDAVLFESIRQAFPGKDVAISNYSEDGSKVVITVDSDVDPGAFYVIDLNTRKALARFPVAAWINPADMAPMKPISFKARDGVELHGYLTAPVTAGPKKLVVLPHGGPIGIRDEWGYNPEVQWLAKNGFTVLQVNYRGSGGYGYRFERAGYRQWAGRMLDDIADGTRWAIAQGEADAAAVCIYGASYGGYAALMSTIQYPDLYKCAVGYAGAYDLPTLKRDSDASWFSVGRKSWNASMGDDTDTLRQISPALHAAEIKVPVFLAHGGEDKRVPPNQFYEMRDALIAAKHPPVTLFKEHEPHGFTSQANNEEMMVKLVEFLNANISGGTPR